MYMIETIENKMYTHVHYVDTTAGQPHDMIRDGCPIKGHFLLYRIVW